MSADASPPAVRATYRHGDLREALVAAGLQMAEAGGPAAVVLREATRRAGVTPNAAYRHFADRDALLRAVADAAQGLAADRMEQAVAAAARVAGPAADVVAGPTIGLAKDPAADTAFDPAAGLAADARRMLRGVGTGYIAFAREQPGLFRTAFSVPDHLANSADPVKAGALGRTPFQILGAALDAWAAAGILPPERRANAELYAWSAVHGLGMLVIDGPLRGLSADMVTAATSRLLDMVERGL
ncbi:MULTISPECIES: TetR/AcrR family transcriptional regulator [Subtercola]|uniref:TetR/AcrR family transcriptional regulator n=1 Tax=Subtercola vilae TaxID=2056433 RepID=A0A4T2BLC9_9MICO|nr:MULTISPECIES: TetR/AcrR family transcriptional regulator [Subtercola]MEA9985862.1 TetR/AcrR family transcriptional regulator [Subtercola sp. RTI3]TIH32305.1 TetR/AcrR family transcriptional regulator [Subtercola vilae]